jgi:Raf kinase inhibitor-like YbhB/YbcL family protein
MPLNLVSDAFESGGIIPVRYTCEGENVSPPFSINGVPAEAKSLVLICDDPDVPNGPFAHWVLYDLAPDVQRCEPDFAANPGQAGGPMPGRNDFGNDRYEGPCPPPGDEPHQYYFRLYALDEPLNLPAGATRAQVLDAMQGRILAQVELLARYGRDAVASERLGIGTRGWDFEFHGEVPHLSNEDRQELRSEANDRLSELTRGNDDMTGASVVVEPIAQGQNQEPFRYRARVVAYIRPDNLAVEEQDDSAQAALYKALDVIERQVREHRDKLRHPWTKPPMAPGKRSF